MIKLDVALPASNPKDESFEVNFKMRQSFSPRVEGVNPAMFVIGDETIFITLYLADFPRCDGKCDPLDVLLHIGGVAALVTQFVQEENGLLKLKVCPPTVTPGRLLCTVTWMQTEAVMQMSAMAPAASIQPVDGLVGGGSELTITAAAKGEFRGDGLFDSGHDSMRHDSMLNCTTGPYFVLLGDVEGEVIGHTIDGVGPRLRVTVKFKTPKATTAGQVWCSLSIGFVGKSSISKQ